MKPQSLEKWEACLAQLRQQVTAAVYETWFAPLRLNDHEEWLVIGVPDKAFYEQFDSKYFAKLYPLLCEYFGQGLKVKYFWNAIEDIAPQKNKKKSTLDPQLIPGYTFETFVKGVSNKTALTVARAIADKPYQDTFNPFFLFGPSGVGKTHLANAIGNRVRELYPEKRVLFVSAHLFKTQYMDATANGKLVDFIHFYQTIDFLIIDDIQELQTAKTQQTFFHIFNHLQQNRRQIIITCDRPPVLFDGIEERMLTRFKWGMVVELEKPDVVLRRDILRAKIRLCQGLRFPKEVVNYIAENVDSNVRDLEGIVNSIMAYSVADSCEIDMELAQRCVARVVNLSQRHLGPEDILKMVCQHFKVKQREVVAKGRKKEVVEVRQLVMYLIHKYTQLSHTQIGRLVGGRDHTTVMHGCTQVTKRLASDKDYRVQIEALEASFKKK